MRGKEVVRWCNGEHSVKTFKAHLLPLLEPDHAVLALGSLSLIGLQGDCGVGEEGLVLRMQG